jgi:hypothetical protein
MAKTKVKDTLKIFMSDLLADSLEELTLRITINL